MISLIKKLLIEFFSVPCYETYTNMSMHRFITKMDVLEYTHLQNVQLSLPNSIVRGLDVFGIKRFATTVVKI